MKNSLPNTICSLDIIKTNNKKIPNSYKIPKCLPWDLSHVFISLGSTMEVNGSRGLGEPSNTPTDTKRMILPSDANNLS